MKIALITKKKLGFVDGSILKLKSGEDKYELWIQVDTMVIGWILHSFVSSIAQNILFLKASRDIWKNLYERFATKDAFRFTDLMEEIHNIKQDSLFVIDYHTNLMILWEELVNLRPGGTCSCEPQCSCSLLKQLQENVEYDQVIRFLKRLNEGFSSMKNQVLCTSPFPSLNTVFNMAVNTEKQLSYDT
jgi:hypothetical protein